MKITEEQYAEIMRKRWRCFTGTDVAMPPVTNKYGAIKTMVGDEKLDSKAEARRYCELMLMEQAGEISNLERQPKFDLIVNGVKVARYVGDFRYFKDGSTVIEDVKGMKTPIYKLKKKLMLACHNIEILETS